MGVFVLSILSGDGERLTLIRPITGVRFLTGGATTASLFGSASGMLTTPKTGVVITVFVVFSLTISLDGGCGVTLRTPVTGVVVVFLTVVFRVEFPVPSRSSVSLGKSSTNC